MMKNTFFSDKKTLNLRGTLAVLDRPWVMGILNVTPDSFFDGGRCDSESALLRQTEKMLREGADLIDVGGASSRPGALPVEPDEELRRVVTAVRAIVKRFPSARLSVDTFRAEVARQALEEGAVMINDISGGEADEAMPDMVAHYRVPYVMMHMRGTPQTMMQQTFYEDFWADIIDYFVTRIDRMHRRGVHDIIVDPGFGFAKTHAQGFELIKHLDHLHRLGKPILIGLSRKSMIWKTLHTTSEEALNGSVVLHTVALLRGAHILRVHDVKEAVEAVKLTNFVM